MPKKQRNVFFIGLLSFFGGISQDIFLPLLPIYLSSLGLSKEFIGLSSGLVTAASSVFKIVAGFLSDKFKNRKAIVFAGYFLSMLSRPLLAVITSNAGILFLRFLDGSGKGIKDSPKDALIADSTEISNRGKSFGIARALDTLGSVAGPLLLFALLYLFQDNPDKYKNIFVLSALPLIATLAIIILKVKETKAAIIKTPAEKGISFKLPKKFYLFLTIMVLFSLGNSSDTFLILKAQDTGVSLLAIPLVYALFNFVYASVSVPVGSLSDRIGREIVIIIGWIFYAISYLGFGLARESWQIWVLFALYGVYFATTEGVAKALVADIVDSSHRGRAYGLYNTVIGLMSLPAGIIAGYLWEQVNSSAPFLFGFIMAAAATLFLFVFLRYFYKQKVY